MRSPKAPSIEKSIVSSLRNAAVTKIVQTDLRDPRDWQSCLHTHKDRQASRSSTFMLEQSWAHPILLEDGFDVCRELRLSTSDFPLCKKMEGCSPILEFQVNIKRLFLSSRLPRPPTSRSLQSHSHGAHAFVITFEMVPRNTFYLG